ncbi:hypothetical protein IAQ61_008024 [Plenodomus lingam]|uniref:RING-type domain-containing protein n=1 Tax=Leptosphaeria maculans (strain JN3 / isolate v23.1.3 / race Av1-4-5-6-7-8) TaxID=985895 RepID=E5A0H0_LEPMJ|nr:hypothetical protein LEMA_P101610.1 [Plenodomus lingam JN3]KAH9867431.1 hypothetical protein IAQ61_008024 [Plenodomus lingam]CBX97030.1 hypothetical protein LEMA_P101610.1 [Plenodomus lingam JN3]
MDEPTIYQDDLTLSHAILSHKARRHAWKAAAKESRKTIPPPKMASVKPPEQNQGTTSIVETIRYECCICGDDQPVTEGVIPCEEHFFCNNCSVEIFTRAIRSLDDFPAKCCSPLPRRLVEHLLSPDAIEAYKLKAKEYYTSPVLRVYCSNEDCRVFLPDTQHSRSDFGASIARCYCGTITCVDCKEALEEVDHVCSLSTDPVAKPDWMPEYTTGCRIKQCPGCHVWVEHRDACNHMRCGSCCYQFCFICLQPWDIAEGFHEGQGCPPYGEPMAGYDEEGYERTPRAIHRDTGYVRGGWNRHSRPKLNVRPAVGFRPVLILPNYHEDDEHYYEDDDDEDDGGDDWGLDYGDYV